MTIEKNTSSPKALISLSKRILNEFALLLRLHLQLLEKEIADGLSLILKAIIAFVLACTIGYLGFIFSGIALILWLSQTLSPLLSTVIVMSLYFFISLGLILFMFLQIKKLASGESEFKEEIIKTSKELQKWRKTLK